MSIEGIPFMQYVEMLIAEKERQYDLRFNAASAALCLSKEQLMRDMEHLNRLRQEVIEDRAQMVNVKVFSLLENRVTAIETRYDARLRLPTIISVLSLVLAAASFVLMLMHG